jgi:uncharacterized protein YqgV (UPF0045/DUF77 family)
MNKATLELKAGATVGDSIEDAVAECVRLAQHLGVRIELEFNGISISVYSSTIVLEAVERYHEALESGKKYA